MTTRNEELDWLMNHLSSTMSSASLDRAHALLAALPREQRKGMCERGQAFKDYVHQRLDAMGVPHSVPESEHDKAGCRIGGRLDYVEARMTPQQEAPGAVACWIDQRGLDNLQTRGNATVGAKQLPGDMPLYRTTPSAPVPAEAQGAVAWASATLQRYKEQIAGGGSRDEYQKALDILTPQPAPVDVRVRALLERMAAHVRPTCSELYDEARALLDGQPAGDKP